MSDVLQAAEGYAPTDDVEEADLILFNTCSVREKAQEKVFSDPRPGQAPEGQRVLIGRRRLRREPGRRAIIERAPYVDVVFGPQTLHRLPEMLARRQSQRRLQVDELPRDREVRPPAAAASMARPPSSRSWKAARSTAASASCPTRAATRVHAARRRARRGRHAGRRGVREVTLLGRTSTPGAAASTATPGPRTSRCCSPRCRIPGIARIRYTTSHPNEFTQRLVDALCARAAAGSTTCILPVQHGSDRILAAMKRGYTVLEVQEHRRRLRAVRWTSASARRLHRRLPGETDEDSRAHDEADRRRRLRRELQLRLQPSGWHARRRARRRHPAVRKLAWLQRLQAAIDERARAHQRVAGRQRPDCARRGLPRRDAHEWMGRTGCNRAVNFRLAGRVGRPAGRARDRRGARPPLRGRPVEGIAA